MFCYVCILTHLMIASGQAVTSTEVSSLSYSLPSQAGHHHSSSSLIGGRALVGKCPICWEYLNEKDLKPLSISVQAPLLPNQQTHFTLLQRAKVN